MMSSNSESPTIKEADVYNACAAEVSVLYVARGIDAGLDAVDSFVNAWKSYPTSCAHKLYFLAKGWSDAEQINCLRLLAEQCAATVLDVSDDGYDWGAYFEALPHVDTEWVCLMNSHSRPQAEGWLSMLLISAKSADKGLAGATGSWESPRWKYSSADPIQTTIWQWLRSLKNRNRWRYFDVFPNPHLRTTGLLLRRTLLQSFADSHQVPRSKFEALVLESGLDGLSRFAQRHGCQLLLVARDGRSFASSEWPSSRTFRSGDQGNLVISDNRTRDYAASDLHGRAYLKKLAWGNTNED